tara:strand:+ start:844 stop:1485 length:642 start_codon:yes stop_codon:yes gene_type:complete
MILGVFAYSIIGLTFFFTIEFIKVSFLLRAENSRKLVHVGSCLIVCTMPFFIDKIGIMILSGLFIVLFVLSRNFGIFSSIHGVSRKTIGEFSMAAGVGISAAVLLPSGIIAFVYGMLILSFADTLANIVGSKWKIWEFKIMSQSKSIGGSIAFFLCSIMISYFTAHYVGLDIKLDMLLIFCLILTLIEAVHIFGLDNLSIPVISGIFWNHFTY